MTRHTPDGVGTSQNCATFDVATVLNQSRVASAFQDGCLGPITVHPSQCHREGLKQHLQDARFSMVMIETTH